MKRAVSVCLSAKADGTKLPPMVVFKAAKREPKALNKEFKNRCVIASSVNGWMDTSLTKVYINSALGSFAFKRRMFVWDSYQSHRGKHQNLVKRHENRYRDHTGWMYKIHPGTRRELEQTF